MTKYIPKIVVAILCIVVIVCGVLSSFKIYKLFAPSATYGSAQIVQLPGDDKDIVLNEDESIFFAYTIENVYLDDMNNGNYRATKTLEALDYDPTNKDYSIYINAHKYVATKMNNLLDAKIQMDILLPDASKTSVLFNIQFIFYTTHTQLQLTIPQGSVGYVNQMIQRGMNVRILEAPIGGDMSVDGTIDVDRELLTDKYSFALTSQMLDLDIEAGTYAPYYIGATEDGSLVATLRRSSDLDFVGFVYHDGFIASPHLSGYEIPWESDTPTIPIRGLISGSNYKITLKFADGFTQDIVCRYKNADKYFGFGDGEDTSSSRQSVLAAQYGPQIYDECSHFKYVYSGDAQSPGTNYGDFHNLRGKLQDLKGFSYPLKTDLGVFDVMINVSFYTQNGTDWSFACGVYLKNPLSGSMDNAVIDNIVQAMHEQIKFDVILPSKNGIEYDTEKSPELEWTYDLKRSIKTASAIISYKANYFEKYYDLPGHFEIAYKYNGEEHVAIADVAYGIVLACGIHSRFYNIKVVLNNTQVNNADALYCQIFSDDTGVSIAFVAKNGYTDFDLKITNLQFIEE